MNSQLIRAKVTEIKQELEIKMQELANIRAECKHQDYTLKHYDPLADCYWTDFTCNICDKRWSEYGSISKHKYLPE